MRLFIQASVNNKTPPTSNELTTNEVRLLVLMGHSEIKGEGANWDSAYPHPVDDFADASELVSDPNVVIWQPQTQTFETLKTGAFVGDTHNNLSINERNHGRELHFRNLYKNYFDTTHTEKLHIAKYYRGGYTYKQAVLGTDYLLDAWNNTISPAINNLIGLGKKVAIHFVIDIFEQPELYPVGATQIYSIDYLIYSLQYLLNKTNVPILLTLWNTQGETGTYNIAVNDYSKSIMNNYTPPVHWTDKTGLNRVSATNIHSTHTAFDYVASQQLPAIASQDLTKLSVVLSPISEWDIIYYSDVQAISQLDDIVITTNVTADVIAFKNILIPKETAITSFSTNIISYRKGIISYVSPLTGITSFEAPYIGLRYEFEIIEKYQSTLNFIDIRGNSLALLAQKDYSLDAQLQHIVDGGVTNGSLLITDSAVPLSVASQTNYDTLITRNWTIDVPRP